MICCTTVFLALFFFCFFFFKQKTAYEMRISDWSSDVCSSNLFLLAALSASVAAIDRRSRSAALFAGVMLALAVQSRETGFAYVVIAGAAFLRADREARRILFWAVSGFAAPIQIGRAHV